MAHVATPVAGSRLGRSFTRGTTHRPPYCCHIRECLGERCSAQNPTWNRTDITPRQHGFFQLRVVGEEGALPYFFLSSFRGKQLERRESLFVSSEQGLISRNITEKSKAGHWVMVIYACEDHLANRHLRLPKQIHVCLMKHGAGPIAPPV